MNLLNISSILAYSSVEIEIIKDLKNARIINEILIALLLLLLVMLCKYKRKHLFEKEKKEELHNLVYLNELTMLPNRNRYYLDEKESILKK